MRIKKEFEYTVKDLDFTPNRDLPFRFRELINHYYDCLLPDSIECHGLKLHGLEVSFKGLPKVGERVKFTLKLKRQDHFSLVLKVKVFSSDGELLFSLFQKDILPASARQALGVEQRIDFETGERPHFSYLSKAF